MSATTTHTSLMQKQQPVEEMKIENYTLKSDKLLPQEQRSSINLELEQAPMIVTTIERKHPLQAPQTIEFWTAKCNKASFAALDEQISSSSSEVGRIFLTKLAPYTRIEKGNITINQQAKALFVKVFAKLGLPSNRDILELHLEKGSNPFRYTVEVTTPRLLSQMTPKRGFTASYYERRQVKMDASWNPERFWNPQSGDFGLSCSGTGRQIQVVAEDEDAPTFIVPRKCSFWEIEGTNDVVVVCDPSLEGVLAEGHSGTQRLNTNIHTRLFFRPNEYHISENAYQDLLHAFTQCQDVLKDYSKHGHRLFVAKMIASHYADVLGVLERQVSTLSSRGWSIGGRNTNCAKECERVQDDWLKFRCIPIRRDLEKTIDEMGVSRQLPTFSHGWEDWESDLQWLRDQFLDCTAQYEALTGAMAAKSGLINEVRNVDEAKLVTMLTVILLFFAPMSLVSSVFSMSESYIPGGRSFWIYWAVSIPVTLAVIGAVVFGRLWWNKKKRGIPIVDVEKGLEKYS